MNLQTILSNKIKQNGGNPIGTAQPYKTGFKQWASKGNKKALFAIDGEGNLFYWTGISRGDKWVRIENVEGME